MEREKNDCLTCHSLNRHLLTWSHRHDCHPQVQSRAEGAHGQQKPQEEEGDSELTADSVSVFFTWWRDIFLLLSSTCSACLCLSQCGCTCTLSLSLSDSEIEVSCPFKNRRWSVCVCVCDQIFSVLVRSVAAGFYTSCVSCCSTLTSCWSQTYSDSSSCHVWSRSTETRLWRTGSLLQLTLGSSH